MRGTGLALLLFGFAAVLAGTVFTVTRGTRPGSDAPQQSLELARMPDTILFFEPPHFVLRTASGSEIARHDARGQAGIPFANLSHDRKRLAYWRSVSESRNAFELVLWDFPTDRAMVLANVSGESPWAGPIWSRDDSALTSVLAAGGTQAPGLAPAWSRLIAITTTGSVREIAKYVQQFPPTPVVAGPDFVSGVQSVDHGARYLVIDSWSGQLLRQAPADRFRTLVGDALGETVLGIARPDEAAGPATVRVWQASDYRAELSVLHLEAATEGMFRPGRSEVVYGTGAGAAFEIEVLDYRAGTRRTAFRSSDRVTPLNFDTDGRWLLVETSGSQRYVAIDLTNTSNVAAAVGSRSGLAIGWAATTRP